MIHRACFGSLERFIGIITENYAGAFPVWLTPIQVKVLPVSNKFHLEYAQQVVKYLCDNGIAAEIDDREEKLGYRMRNVQMQKIPYTLVLGDKEKESMSVNVRKYGKEGQEPMQLEAFLAYIKEKIASKDSEF